MSFVSFFLTFLALGFSISSSSLDSFPSADSASSFDLLLLAAAFLESAFLAAASEDMEATRALRRVLSVVIAASFGGIMRYAKREPVSDPPQIQANKQVACIPSGGYAIATLTIQDKILQVYRARVPKQGGPLDIF